MHFFDSLSLRSRFLIAPLIGVLLTLIVFLNSQSTIESHLNLLRQISQSNLIQVGEIARTVTLLSTNHEKLKQLLRSATITPDEEKTDSEGRVILDELHSLEAQLHKTLGSSQQIVDGINVVQLIKVHFNRLREETINIIELSSVKPELAEDRMHDFTRTLGTLNGHFISLSDSYVKNLTAQSANVEESLYDKSSLTILSSVSLALMLISALYFSRRLSSEIDQVNQSLIDLSKGNTEVKLHARSHTRNAMHQLYDAVYTFKRSLDKNEEQQETLNHTIEELTDNKERYLSLLNLVPTAIIAFNESLEILLFNKAAESIYGYSSQEVIGKHTEMLVPERHRHNLKNYYKSYTESNHLRIMTLSGKPLVGLKQNGEEFYIEATAATLDLARDNIMTLAITDITDRIQAENEILHKAHYDTLTGLPNRFLALECLDKGLKTARDNEQVLAVFFLDLDGFKKINDTLGHDTGDKLLIEAGRRLQTVVRPGDTVARLGGDEFIVIISGLRTNKDAIPTAQQAVEQFRNPFKIDARELILTSSIGIATFPEDGDNASEILRKADSAMYNAKASGRNTYTFFTESMNREVARELAVEEQLHSALKRREFRLVYQLQVDIKSGYIIGAEALVRWDNAILGPVSPDEFIPIAEHTGLIIPISQFVINESLLMLAFWQKRYGNKFRMAVNLSPRLFRDPNLISFIVHALVSSGVSADTVELEVTEGVLMSGHSFIDDALTGLSDLGIRLAMDDFGTGYSSLSYLRRYSFDTLKIDQSFIRDIAISASNRELVNAIIAMAHALGLEVVAEGVETKMQLAFLAKRQCKYAQGYLFNKPIPSNDVTALLEQQKTNRTPALKLAAPA